MARDEGSRTARTCGIFLGLCSSNRRRASEGGELVSRFANLHECEHPEHQHLRFLRVVGILQRYGVLLKV